VNFYQFVAVLKLLFQSLKLWIFVGLKSISLPIFVVTPAHRFKIEADA